jgi:hypothetical protein
MTLPKMAERRSLEVYMAFDVTKILFIDVKERIMILNFCPASNSTLYRCKGKFWIIPVAKLFMIMQ